MNIENRIFQYLFLLLFAVLTGYTMVIRSSFYGEDALPKAGIATFRVSGENLAGDYALFRLLEENSDEPTKAYDAEAQTEFLKDKVHTNGDFAAFAAPTKSFIAVPFLILSYEIFFETWQMWGMFLFGIALYSLFPLKKALLLLFALPGMFLATAFGGWSLFISAAFILTLVQAENHPRWAGFFGGLLIAEPLCFCIVQFALYIRKQKRAAKTAAVFAAVILFFTLTRYGLGAFAEAILSGGRALLNTPCDFISIPSVFLCAGFPVWFAALFYLSSAVAVIYYGFILFFRRPLCQPSVQDAYLCAAALLLMPFSQMGDYVMVYAAFAFLLNDSDDRAFLPWDKAWILLAFISIYLDGYFMQRTGVSLQLVLASAVPFLCWRRSL